MKTFVYFRDCGSDLDIEYDGDKIFVKPCNSCSGEDYNAGYDDGVADATSEAC